MENYEESLDTWRIHTQNRTLTHTTLQLNNNKLYSNAAEKHL